MLDIATKIGLAALLAGAVGAEREWTGKWAGLRTHMLIAVGAALLTDVSVHIGAEFSAGSGAWDPGRIAAQIVTGVGFLGAGTILQSRGGVRGLTTAAGLWVSAAIGLAVGAHFYVEAVVTTVVLLLILAALRPVERMLLHRDRRKVLVGLPAGRDLGSVTAVVEDLDLQVERLDVEEIEGHRSVKVTFRGSRQTRRELVKTLEDAGLETKDAED